MDAWASPDVVAALEELERIEQRAYAAMNQSLTPRAKLARIRLLRREAQAVANRLKEQR